jgi:hypothetical protein
LHTALKYERSQHLLPDAPRNAWLGEPALSEAKPEAA